MHALPWHARFDCIIVTGMHTKVASYIIVNSIYNNYNE